MGEHQRVIRHLSIFDEAAHLRIGGCQDSFRLSNHAALRGASRTSTGRSHERIERIHRRGLRARAVS